MTASPFAPRSDADIAQLVAAHPLAWVVPRADPSHATPLPLRIERLDGDRIATLTGHTPRRFALVESLRADPRATLLFGAPHGYVSPSWFTDRSQAPTWNFAVANFDVRIGFLDTPEDLERIVRDLVDAMESGRDKPWKIEEMGARYAQLAQRIVAFRATVQGVTAKFKLGQDERDDTYPEIVAGLARGGHGALVALMDEFNAHRAATGGKS